MRQYASLIAAILLSVPVARAGAAPPSPKVLVGVNYFAGWWEELPNKWHGKGWNASEPDWRPLFPERVPLLGEYNAQATMDREIVAAADHGVDFFSILWYFAHEGSPQQTSAARLNRGLETFLASPNAGRMKFIIEYCNAPTFSATDDGDWSRCVQTWVAAMRHPSALRVDQRLVFKIADISSFLRVNDRDTERCVRQLNELRKAARVAGLGEILIGGGIMSRSQIKAGNVATKLFDFTATYMSIPDVEVREAEHPYAALAAEARQARPAHADDPLPWVPYLAAGWNPRPWTHPQADPNHRRFFTPATREQWFEELRAVRDDLTKYPRLGLPRADGTRQPVFTIYAWNEFGEGGIVAPTQGEGWMKLDAIRDVFAPGHNHP